VINTFKVFIVFPKSWYMILNEISSAVRLKTSQVNNRSATK